jgi:hypothetical protein
MEIINNIYQYQNFKSIEHNLPKIKTLPINYKLNTNIKKLLSLIYNNNYHTVDKIFKYINDAIKILNNQSKYEIQELSDSAFNVMFKLNNIPKATILNIEESINDFNDTLLLFQTIYNKYINPVYNILLTKTKNISNLLHLSIYSNNKTARNILKKEIENLYDTNNEAGIQFIASKSKYILNSDPVLYNLCWNRIKKTYAKNPTNTFFILFLELRKYYLENNNNTSISVKRTIYFDIDIQDIRTCLQNGNINSITIIDTINYFLSISNLKLLPKPSNNIQFSINKDILATPNYIDQLEALYRYNASH